MSVQSATHTGFPLLSVHSWPKTHPNDPIPIAHRFQSASPPPQQLRYLHPSAQLAQTNQGGWPQQSAAFSVPSDIQEVQQQQQQYFQREGLAYPSPHTWPCGADPTQHLYRRLLRAQQPSDVDQSTTQMDMAALSPPQSVDTLMHSRQSMHMAYTPQGSFHFPSYQDSVDASYPSPALPLPKYVPMANAYSGPFFSAQEAIHSQSRAAAATETFEKEELHSAARTLNALTEVSTPPQHSDTTAPPMPMHALHRLSARPAQLPSAPSSLRFQPGSGQGMYSANTASARSTEELAAAIALNNPAMHQQTLLELLNNHSLNALQQQQEDPSIHFTVSNEEPEPLDISNHSPSPSSAPLPLSQQLFSSPPPLPQSPRVMPRSPPSPQPKFDDTPLSRTSPPRAKQSPSQQVRSPVGPAPIHTESAESKQSEQHHVGVKRPAVSVQDTSELLAVAVARKKSARAADEGLYKSIIECGFVRREDTLGGATKTFRVFSIKSSFFDDQVINVYTAQSDPYRRILYKTSDVAHFFHCSPNMLAMYLKRRKVSKNQGIYQAIEILHREDNAKDLKAGGYFVALEVCIEFKTYLDDRKHRPGKSTRDSGDNGRKLRN